MNECVPLLEEYEGWYIGGMKVKTSVTLSEDVLKQLDAALGARGNRSEFIEETLKRRLRDIRRAERDARDAAIYARMAADPEVQREIEETHSFAVPWWELGDDVELSDEVVERLEREAAARAAG